MLVYTTDKNLWEVYCSIHGQELHHGIVKGSKSKADRFAAQLNGMHGNLGHYHVREAKILVDE